jgi:hypothetical protein
MKKFITLFTVVFSLSKILAQGFNGTIEFKYFTQKDTSINVFLVKNQTVRLDQYNKKSTVVEGSFLFDLTKGEVKFLNPKRKLYGTQKSETPQVIRGECVVVKGTGTKNVVGIKCNEYAVKNAEENTVITYWVADAKDAKYTFFSPMMKLRNGKDRQSIYYGQIKNLPEGAMPLLSEEKQLSTGTLLTRLEATKISNTAPDDATMAIPAGYNKFDQ